MDARKGFAGFAPRGKIPIRAMWLSGDRLCSSAQTASTPAAISSGVFAREFKKPVVVAGFEPLDVMQSILMLIRQVNDGRHEVENQYIRAVTEDGNAKAQAAIAEFFELRDSFEWRGLGEVPNSALRLRPQFANFDAEKRFDLVTKPAKDNPACECGAILRGVKRPRDCKLFGTVCTPDNPMGSCMVSSEGACAAHWTYGRFREKAARQEAAE